MTKITEISTFRQHKKKTEGEGISTLSIKIWYNNQKNRHNENGRYPWILLGGGAAQVLRADHHVWNTSSKFTWTYYQGGETNKFIFSESD